jgi:hypothetical protein
LPPKGTRIHRRVGGNPQILGDAADKIELIVTAVSHRDTTGSVSHARQRRWMLMRANTWNTPSATSSRQSSRQTIAMPDHALLTPSVRFIWDSCCLTCAQSVYM